MRCAIVRSSLLMGGKWNVFGEFREVDEINKELAAAELRKQQAKTKIEELKKRKEDLIFKQVKLVTEKKLIPIGG